MIKNKGFVNEYPKTLLKESIKKNCHENLSCYFYLINNYTTF